MTIKSLLGVHHVTAITSSAKKIYDFYTNILGLRLVKKNVNQDDLATYHLFFADDRGNPGTDMTFFDFKGIGPRQAGTHDISRTSFRIPNDQAYDYWLKRFNHFGINYQEKLLFKSKVLYFEDFDQQRYALWSDEHNVGVTSGEPWHLGPVPDEFAITGLGPIYLTVSSLTLMDQLLKEVLQLRFVTQENDLALYEMGQGGHGAQVIIKEDKTSPLAKQGYGGVHHFAFRVLDPAHLKAWEKRLNDFKKRNSGSVDRYYFKSVYVRLYPNILFELATDGPGFIDDEETYEVLGEKLTLPLHLRQYRTYIETQLPEFDTVRSNKVFKKEYFDE